MDFIRTRLSIPAAHIAIKITNRGQTVIVGPTCEENNLDTAIYFNEKMNTGTIKEVLKT